MSDDVCEKHFFKFCDEILYPTDPTETQTFFLYN